MTKDDLAILAGYNAWANGRIFEACASVPPDAYFADRGAFFKSLHGTLNHLLVTDRLWLARLQGRTPDVTRLDAVPFDDFASLRAARHDQDQALIDHVDGLDDAAAMAPVTYRNLAGDTFSTPHGLLVTTMVNHGTHHRGHAHTLLTQGGFTAPVLDLPPFLATLG